MDQGFLDVGDTWRIHYPQSRLPATSSSMATDTFKAFGGCSPQDLSVFPLKELLNLENIGLLTGKSVEEVHSIYRNDLSSKTDGMTGIYHLSMLQVRGFLRNPSTFC